MKKHKLLLEQIDFKEAEIETIEEKINEYEKTVNKKRPLNPSIDNEYFMMIGWKEHLEKELEDIVKEENNYNKIKNKILLKLPDNNESYQYDMFRDFVAPSNDRNALSNLFKEWDLNSPCIVSPREQSRIRKSGKTINIKMNQEIDGDIFSTTIQPAMLSLNKFIREKYKMNKEEFPSVDNEGNELLYPFYPWDTEHYIERIIRKLLLDEKDRYGIHSNKPKQTWVRYNHTLLVSELAYFKKHRSNNEVKHALNIMLGCNLTKRKNGKIIHQGGMLVGKIDQQKINYRDKKQWSAVQLPYLVTAMINKLDFRQYDYRTNLKLKYRLSSWLMDKISLKCTNVNNINNVFEITYNQIQEQSSLLGKRKDHNIAKIKKCHDEMVKHSLLYFPLNHKQKPYFDFKIIYKKDGREYEDIKYKFYLTRQFVNHIKAANSRNLNLILQ